MKSWIDELRIANRAAHTSVEHRLVSSLDEGVALHEAIELLKKQEPTVTEECDDSD